MVFEKEYEIGISHIDRALELTDRGVLTYFEETSAKQTQTLGFGLDSENGRRYVWMILDWRVRILKRPHYADKIKVKTWSRRVQRIYAYRDFEMYSESGELIALADSKWVLFDLVEGKVMQMVPELSDKFLSEPDRAAFESEAPRISVPKCFVNEACYTVRRGDIDTGMHMHNTRYITAALEVLPSEVCDGGGFDNIRICYNKEYKLGDEIRLFYGLENGVHTVVMKDKEGTLHAVLVLER